jgi:hypothetical protein
MPGVDLPFATEEYAGRLAKTRRAMERAVLVPLDDMNKRLRVPGGGAAGARREALSRSGRWT